MNRRHSGGDQDNQNSVNGQLKQLFDDDAFLTDLSRGVDPSEGSDALAGLLLNLNKEARADMPAAPDLSKLLPGFEDLDGESTVGSAEGSAQDSNPGTTEFAPINDSENNSDTSVVALDSRRSRRDRKARTSHPFLSGLVGAAAATLVIAGGGTAIYNADAGSPLYGMNKQLFGNNEHPSVVELASTLEEVDSRTASGDVEGARELLEQARTMLNDMNERQGQAQEVGTPAPVPTTETITNTVTETSVPEQPTPAAETVTATQTQVQTVTSTVVAPPVWTPQPSTSVEPTVPSTPVGGTEAPGDGGGLAPPQTPGN